MNDFTDLASQRATSRILVIDDNQAIHQDFRKIFGANRERTPSSAELALFGAGAGFTGAPEFQIDSAYQGQEGVELVRLAQEQQSPYALAFVDVRMPPGCDGIETTARIWQHDLDIQIVICTAYSDYSWSEMLAKLGRSDRLVILKKPFDTIEVVQLASALSEKWRLARQSRSMLEDLERTVAERTRELVQAGERLLASEAQYRLLFDSNPHPMWVYDMETLRFVTANGAAVAHYGYSEQQFLSMTVRDIRSVEDVATVEKDAEELQGQGKRSSVRRHRKQDGSLIDVEISSDRIVFNGRPARLVLAHDVTERERAAEDLLRSENLKGAILEASLDCLITIDHEGKVVEFNPAAQATFGLTREQALGKVMVELIVPPRLRDAHRRGFAQYLATGKGPILGKRIELEAIRADGTEFPIELTIVAIGATSTPMFTGFIRDITELKRASDELRESERRLSDMLGSVQLASIMLDREARITYCNEYFLRLTGWQREEVVGRDWFELFLPFESHHLKKVFATFLADLPETWHRENEIFTRSGERRLIRWNITGLRSGAGDVIGTASIGEDITEQKRAETRIKRLNRVYTVLSRINSLIVRVRDRNELFTEACQIAVEHGQFKMAWIGVVDRSAMKIMPVASAGVEPEFLSLIDDRFSLREDILLLGNTKTARAVLEKKAIVTNEIGGDTTIIFAKESIDRGILSSAILPLLVSGDAVGVLVLYAGESGFFDAEEMKLLEELAGDIAFAIDHIGKQERLDYLAYYDSLTGLANRALFHERLQQGVMNANEHGHKLALVLLDIERFRTINDTLGRQSGDALLEALAARLSTNMVDTGRLARIDTDHFAVMVREVQSEAELARLIERRFAEIFGPPFRIGDSELRISAKFGIAMCPADGADADTLFRNAEAALRNAKASGERYLFYTQTMNERVAEKLALENKLRQAIEKGEFVLHYQPKVNLASGKLSGAEALIRWNDPRTGLVPPGRFIPILEETGLIHEVGRWALRKAIEDYLRWYKAGLAAVRIAVNVSPLQLRNRAFIAELQEAIGIDQHAAAGLELEITESLIMEDVKHTITSLQAIRAMGVSIAIDDFGTGFSSLSYLSKLPVDTVKIDRSFVIEMTAAPEGLALVSTIISLAHSLKLKVVAEGVETEEQSRLLRLLSCDEMQGYFFCKPVPGEIFEARYLAPPIAA